MAKYDRNVLDVRKLSRELIPKLLANKPRKLEYIFSRMKEEYSQNCIDEIKCECGKYNRSSQEWKHQVRWAIQDLKYNKKLIYDRKSGLYSLNKS